MAERHRGGFGRDFEGNEGGDSPRGGPREGGAGPRGGGGRFGGGGGGRFGGSGGGGRFGGPPGSGGPGGPGGDRGFGGPPRGDRGFSGPPREYQERRPPASPEEASEFQDVDADLAIALLDTATRLTEIVGTAGLPEGHTERRQAVVETFEVIYFSILEAVTGGEEEEEEAGGDAE